MDDLGREAGAFFNHLFHGGRGSGRGGGAEFGDVRSPQQPVGRTTTTTARPTTTTTPPTTTTTTTIPPASLEVRRHLPRIKITAEDLIESCNRECAICTEALAVGDVVTRLPRCAHLFHPWCIDDWFQRSCVCPVCRYELPTDDPQFEAGRLDRMRHRKPRFAHYELTRLSIAELKTLLTTANGNGRTSTTSSIPRSIMDKQSLIDYLVQQDCIELVRTNTEQVSYRLSDLQHLYSIKQLRQIMNDAGVFYDRKLVVEKEDMIRIFIASGRLLLLPEEPEPQPQQPLTVETVHSDDEADDDNSDEHYHQHHHRGHRESSPSPRRYMHQVMEEVSPAGPPDDSHHGPSSRRGADVVEQPQHPQQECGATPLAPPPPPLPSAPVAQPSFMEYLLEQVGTLGTTELAMLHETICQLLEDRNNSNNSNDDNNHNNHNNHNNDQR